MTEPMVDPDTSADDRRKHLEFIQAIVTRMSSASATSKGWLLPVVTLTYGYALTGKSRPVGLLGIAAVALFALLDANYLRQEKAYRHLYDAVARGARKVPLFSLDPSHADDAASSSTSARRKIRQALNRWFPDRDVWLSWSIAPFYGGLAIVGAIVVVVK